VKAKGKYREIRGQPKKLEPERTFSSPSLRAMIHPHWPHPLGEDTARGEPGTHTFRTYYYPLY
jgi:hypothetical protein